MAALDVLGATGWTEIPGDLPPEPGAYVLIVELDRPLRLAHARLGKVALAPGRYAYAGSARGPGGIRARVARHFRTDKKPHWHIDLLTAEARIAGALALPGRSECEIVAELLARGAATAPVKGFGSSDCAVCPAHLLALN